MSLTRLYVPPRRPPVALASALVASVFFLTVVAEVAFADPSQWAPAYGNHTKKNERNKNKANHTQVDVVDRAPYGIDTGNCNRQLIGSAFGGAAGVVSGSSYTPRASLYAGSERVG